MLVKLEDAWNLLIGCKLFRFAIIGFVSGSVYLCISLLIGASAGLGSEVSSVIGYCCALPINFLGQKVFTFEASGNLAAESTKFLLVALLGIVLSYLVVALLVGIMQQPFWVGLVGVIAAVPIASYLLFDSWVFREHD